MKEVGVIEMDLSSNSVADNETTPQAIILFYPFPDEKIETIASLLYGEAVQSYKTKNKVTFCKVDFESLNHGEWLNDTVVDGWMQW